ncbi:Tyramine receptor 1 [Holothuria leucospilota]|uniref:Tyramine receptor 1 n=1 Tax=Holothuria leucospilota TaxID=206669 RepID=A0A9Q1C5P3_HOLLE|nr:Tyramine receptor 1 [Holothuria leucospilota]
MKLHHVFLMIAGGWFCALAMVIPPLTGSASTSVYTHGTHHCSPSWKDSCLYYNIGVALVYCITIPTLVICYGLITLTIKRSADRLADYAKRGQRDVQFTVLPTTDNTQNDPRIEKNQVEASSHQEDTFQEDSFVLNSCSNAQSFDQISSISDRLDVNSQLKQLPVTEKGDGIVKEKPAHSKLPHYRRYDKKVALSGAMLVLTTTVCWTPYFIVHTCNVEKTPSHGLEVFTMWLAYFNAALDPVIYTMLNKKIHKAVMEPFHFLRASITSKCFHSK